MSSAADSLGVGRDVAGDEQAGDHAGPTRSADLSWQEYDEIIALFYLDISPPAAGHTAKLAMVGNDMDTGAEPDVYTPGSSATAATEAPLVSASDVKRRPGWSEAALSRFLGPPDGVEANPHCPTGSPMRLYRAGRVEAVEAAPEFSTWREGHAQRSERARLAATRGRACALEAVAAWVPGLSELNWADVLVQALDERNEREMSCADHGFIAVHADDAPSLVAEVVVDFLIRHGAEIVIRATRPGDRTAVRAALRARLGQLVAEQLAELVGE